MDNQKPQFIFTVKDRATIRLDNGTAIFTNVYKQSPEGIAFITNENLDNEQDKNVDQEYYYFFPWSRIRLFMVQVKKEDPIKTAQPTPQG